MNAAPSHDFSFFSKAITEFLSQFKGQTIHYYPNPGNGGDCLIAAGTYQVFRRVGLRYEFIPVGDRSFDPENKIIFYAGGGNLVPFYTQARDFLERVHRKARRVVMLPHTIRGHEDLIAAFGSNVDLIARERRSYDHIRSCRTAAGVHLMHDMAFALDVPAVRSLWQPIQVLSRTSAAKLAREYWRSLTVKGPSGPTLNCFRVDVEKTDRPLPPDNIDVSIAFNGGQAPAINAYMTTRNILDFLDRYDTVNTNRLHLGIGAAILGKKTFLERNDYDKNLSIYEFSLRDHFPNVAWREFETDPAGAVEHAQAGAP